MKKFETERMETIYAEAVNFCEGMNMVAKEVFEIMYDAKEYTVPEICYIVGKLLADGFIR